MESHLPLLTLLLIGCSGGVADDAGIDAATASDAGSRPDATSSPDAGRDAAPGDAGSLPDAAITDAAITDAGATCNLDAVRFAGIARGPLQIGALCDEVNVCVRNRAEAARVMAASSRFSCAASAFPCTGMTCSYRDPAGPSEIDAAELQEICAVTTLTPTPDIACVVFGP